MYTSLKVMFRTTLLPMEPIVRPSPLDRMRSKSMFSEPSFTQKLSSSFQTEQSCIHTFLPVNRAVNRAVDSASARSCL